MKIRLEDLYPRVQNVTDYTDLAALATPLTDVLYHVQSGISKGKLFIYNGLTFDLVAGSAGITSVNSSVADFAGNVQIGGIFRGPFASSTQYKQLDEVIEGAIMYYAKADFTSTTVFDSTNWTSTSPVKIQNYTVVTYVQLVTLVAASALIATTYYLISDFQTVHNFPEGGGINVGELEAIIVQASSANTLFAEAASISFPQDTIYYSLTDFNIYIPGSLFGAIYRRVDNQYNNDFPYDFRNCKFRRWLDPVTNLYTTSYDRNVTNTNIFQDFLTFSPTNYGGGQIVNNIWNTATHVPSDYGNPSFYQSIDLVCDATSIVNYTDVKDGCMIGVTLIQNSQFSTSSFIGYYFGSLTLIKSFAYGLYFFGDYSNASMYIDNSDITYFSVTNSDIPQIILSQSSISFISFKKCYFGYPLILNLTTYQNKVSYLDLVECKLLSSFQTGSSELSKYFYRDKEVFTDKIGDPSTLVTIAKDSLVAAINEVSVDITSLQNNTASITNAVYTWVGDPSLNSFAVVPFGIANTFIAQNGGPGALDPLYLQPHDNKYGFLFDNNTVCHQFNSNTFNGITLRNYFNSGFSQNTTLGFFTDNIIGKECHYNTFGDQTGLLITGNYMYKCTTGRQVNDVRIGNSCTNINIQDGCTLCDVGNSCSNITLSNCNGTSSADANGNYIRLPFIVPDGTTNKYYENNIEMPDPNDARTKLAISANLSDLSDKAAARANLGLIDALHNITYADALAIAKSSVVNTFIAGTTYRISNRILQGAGTTGDIIVYAVGERELSSSAQFYTAVPDYINGIVWAKNTNAATEVIHLGKTWVLQTGGVVIQEPITGSTSWALKTGVNVDLNGNSLYEVNEVIYTLDNDWIAERKDTRGNIISNSLAGALNIGNITHRTIDEFPWGHNYIFSNYISDATLNDVFLRAVIDPYIINNRINKATFTSPFGIPDTADNTNANGMYIDSCVITYCTFQNTTFYNFTAAAMYKSDFYGCNLSFSSGLQMNLCKINGLGSLQSPCNFTNNNLVGATINSMVAPTQTTYFSNNVGTGTLNMGQNENHENEVIGYTASIRSLVQDSMLPLTTVMSPSVTATQTALDLKQTKPTGGNVGYGYGAGGVDNSGGTGYGNVFLGSLACYSITNGYENTALGDEAGLSTTVGRSNTYIGMSAGYSGTTASFNTFFGAYAGELQTGNENSYIGFAAGFQGSGGKNTAQGNRSYFSLTTGSHNTGAGNGAGNSVTTGMNNTLLGGDASYLQTTANDCVFVGSWSGKFNRTGNNHVSIGSNSGPTIGTLTNTIAIGFNAQTTTSNTMVLGGMGADAVNVGIGTQTPGSKLTVFGIVESTSGGIKFPDGTIQTTAGSTGSSSTITSVTPSFAGTTLTITTNIGTAATTLPVPDVNKAYVDAADTLLSNNITTNSNAIATKANLTDLVYKSGTGNGSITSKGAGNVASGAYAVVVGGLNNTAAGDYTTADGHDNIINGLECHAYGSRGCTIAVACVRVTLINCTNFAVTTGTDLTYFNNVVYTVYPEFNPYDITVALRTSVVQGIFSTDSNELQGTQPTGSIQGMRFGWYNYDYEYKPGNDGTYKWNRNYRDSSGALVPDVTSWPAFNVFGGASTIVNGSYLKISLNALPNFDTHNAWNGSGYVIPNTGTYQIDMTLRIADNTSYGISYGIGCDTTLISNNSFGWRMSSASGPTTVRHGASHQRTARFNQGDVVYYYGYFDGGASVNVASAELTILRIR